MTILANKNTAASRAFLAAAIIGLLIARCRAEEKLPERQSVKHRITGLFCPDRDKDLREVMKSLLHVTIVSIDYKNSEATFLYDADTAFNHPKPEEVIQRFDDLLRSASNSTFGIRPLCTIPNEKLKRVEIPIVGLDCKACCLAAYESIYKIEGVEQATVSFKEGLVSALINPEKTNLGALEAALKQKGVTLKIR